jgi:hypothetical protein
VSVIRTERPLLFLNLNFKRFACIADQNVVTDLVSSSKCEASDAFLLRRFKFFSDAKHVLATH